MQIVEFQKPIMFHPKLNIKLWQGNDLLPEVRMSLLKQAKEFIKFLKMDELPLKNIIITGSNTNLTYTPHSDIDLHIVVDMQKIYGGHQLTEQFFDSKRRLWNHVYDIKVREIPVEIYVEDDDETVEGNAYSLISGEWLQRKDLMATQYDDRSVKTKYNWLARELTRYLERADSTDDISRLMDKLKNYRQAGLDQHGELSTENLVFKALRNNGWLGKINDKRTDIVNKTLSLD